MQAGYCPVRLLEKPEAPQVFLSPLGCTKEAGQGLAVHGITAAMVMDARAPPVLMAIDMTTGSGSPL